MEVKVEVEMGLNVDDTKLLVLRFASGSLLHLPHSNSQFNQFSILNSII